MTSKVGSFSTYVEAAQAARSGQTTQTAGPDSWDFSHKLLQVIATSADRSLVHLQSVSGLDFATFAQVLQSLKALGLVTVSGDPPAETAEITPAGSRMVALSSLGAGE
jgi:hypothetical protein